MKSYATREIGGIIFAWYWDKEPEGEPDVFDVITDPSFMYDHIEDSWGVGTGR